MGLSSIIARLSESLQLRLRELIAVVLIAGMVGCGGSPISTPAPSPIPQVPPPAPSSISPTLPLRAAPTRTPVPTVVYPTARIPGKGEEARIAIGDNLFQPVTITVTVGAKVIWFHIGEEHHSVTASDHSWGIPAIEEGDSFTQIFQKAGAYEYFCTHHAEMVGTVVVLP